MADKLYVVTRADLAAGARAAQSVHAAIEFFVVHGQEARRWYDASNTVVLLEVPDEAALLALAARCRASGVLAAPFHEDDLGGSLTAVALEPAGAELVRGLPLALRPVRRAGTAAFAPGPRKSDEGHGGYSG